MAIPELQFREQVFRAHDPRWAWDSESGEGARLHGGRFNPRGTPALYLSLTPEGAWAEAQQAFPFKPQPLVICAYQVDCQRIVDLRNPKVRKLAGVSAADLGCAWEEIVARNATPPTHELAKQLVEAGVSGILVPSFAPGAPDKASNLVVWRWGRDRPHRIQCIDDEGRLAALAPDTNTE